MQSPRAQRKPIIMMGMPEYNINPMLRAATCTEDGAVLMSAGRLWVKGKGWRRLGMAPWRVRMAALDCGGYTAASRGGYPWRDGEDEVTSYVDYVVTNGAVHANEGPLSHRYDDPPRGSLPFPWAWWAAPDRPCEQDIAPDEEAVRWRLEKTAQNYRETLAYLDWWRGEGLQGVPDPLPVLQGWRPDHYLRSIELMTAAAQAEGREGLPHLVGVGSVCGRHLHGPTGLLRVFDVLDRALPPHVELHGFGLKGGALEYAIPRLYSVDSMAWDYGARTESWARGYNSTQHRAVRLSEWAKKQEALRRGPRRALQSGFWGHGYEAEARPQVDVPKPKRRPAPPPAPSRQLGLGL